MIVWDWYMFIIFQNMENPYANNDEERFDESPK